MRPATAVTTVLLLLIAVAHLLRLVFGVPVTVGGTSIPVWVSAVGTLVPAVLAIGLWRERAVPPSRA